MKMGVFKHIVTMRWAVAGQCRAFFFVFFSLFLLNLDFWLVPFTALRGDYLIMQMGTVIHRIDDTKHPSSVLRGASSLKKDRNMKNCTFYGVFSSFPGEKI
jgi:hypothetical protein